MNSPSSKQQQLGKGKRDVSPEIYSDKSPCYGTSSSQRLSPVNKQGQIDQWSECVEAHVHVSFSGLALEIQTLREESLQLKAQATHMVRHCQKIEARFTACQKENQRLERMNTLMERLLRRERQKNGYLLNRCAGQEGMLSSFRKDLPSVQNGMSSLLETWEDIGYTRAKQ